jgi:hypothetical protein
MNIIEAILEKNNFIVLLTANDNKLLEEISKDICNDLNFIYLDYFNVEDYSVINSRIESLIDTEKNIGIIIFGKSFPSENLDFNVNYHIHINKKDNNEYIEILKTNIINKFINLKEGININDIIFDLIIKKVESMLYKKN